MPQSGPGRAGGAADLLHRGALLLALTLVAVKAFYLGNPTLWGWGRYARALAATTSLDVVFVLGLWLAALAALAMCGGRPRLGRAVVGVFLGTAAVSALYAVASVVMFGIFGGFLTYHLLTLVGDLRMVRSSVTLHLTPAVASSLVLLPVAYLAVLIASQRIRPFARPAHGWRMAASACLLAAWAGAGQYAYAPRVDHPAGSPDRGERALGAGVVDRARGDARRHGAVVGGVRRRRPRRLCAAGPTRPRRGRARGLRAAPACDTRQRAESGAATQRDSGRARGGRRPLDQPRQRALRHHAHPHRRSRALARLRQLLRPHRAQFQLARGDSALHVSEARLPGRHRAVPRARRHLARVAVPRARLPDVVRDAQRPAVGGMARVHRRPAASTACATTAT